MKTTFLLLVAVLAVTLLSPCRAAPRKPIDTYDKRQDGKLNVDSKISNILILFAPSALHTGNLPDVSGLIENALLTQSLGLRNVIPRIAGHPENEEIDAKLEDAIDSARISNEESSPKKVEDPKPSVKLIAAVQKDSPEAVESSQSQSILENEKEVKPQVIPKVEAQEASETSKKSARSLKKVSGELSVSKLPPRETQLPLENKVAGENESEDREPQELKLIGGGIENCGPDRFRDRFGICQARVEKQ